MRVDPEQRNFAEYLLKVGNGHLPVNAMETLCYGLLLIEEVFGEDVYKRQPATSW